MIGVASACVRCADVVIAAADAAVISVIAFLSWLEHAQYCVVVFCCGGCCPCKCCCHCFPLSFNLDTVISAPVPERSHKAPSEMCGASAAPCPLSHGWCIDFVFDTPHQVPRPGAQPHPPHSNASNTQHTHKHTAHTPTPSHRLTDQHALTPIPLVSLHTITCTHTHTHPQPLSRRLTHGPTDPQQSISQVFSVLMWWSVMVGQLVQ